MSRRVEIEEDLGESRPGYRRLMVTAAGRRFGVLHTPDRGAHQPTQTLVSARVGDELWSTSHILALDGHVSALACIDIIERAYFMAGKARGIGYEKRASEIRSALGCN